MAPVSRSHATRDQFAAVCGYLRTICGLRLTSDSPFRVVLCTQQTINVRFPDSP
jgi:hypothetical protein